MRFASPWGFAAAGLLAPLTLWYLLRTRRARVVVASTFLWRQVDRSVAAAVPWQRFRPDRTFWLVGLAILTGAVALARPTLATQAALGDHTIILLDTSASMSADEGGPSRLELARRQARALVDRIGPGQTLSILEAGPRARVLLAAASDAAAARDAIARAVPSGGAADFADAFTLAASLQRPGESTVTRLFTDGPVPQAAVALAPPGLVVDGVGEDRPNLSVARLQALPGTGGGAQVFAQVRNAGQLATGAAVTVSVDGVEVARRDVELAARAAEDLIVDVGDIPPGAPGVVRAAVAPRGRDAAGAEATDSLALDDSAVALLSAPRDVTAVVAGPGNVFVESALAAVPGVEVRSVQAVPEDLSGVDILVVDRVIAPVRPAVPTLYVAPTRPPADITVNGLAQRPALTFQDPGSQLLTDVDLSGVAIAQAQRVDAPTLQVAASGPDGPLLLAGRLGDMPVVYLPLRLGDSNLPLQVAWPVLVANIVTALAGPQVTTPLTAGTEATLSVPAGATGLEVVPPAGRAVTLDPLRPQLRVDVPGVYEVRYRGPESVAARGPTLLAVNPDPGESDLARGRPEPLEAPGARSGPAAVPRNGRRGVGALVLIVPLAALIAEWFARPDRRRRSAPVSSSPKGGRR